MLEYIVNESGQLEFPYLGLEEREKDPTLWTLDYPKLIDRSGHTDRYVFQYCVKHSLSRSAFEEVLDIKEQFRTTLAKIGEFLPAYEIGEVREFYGTKRQLDSVFADDFKMENGRIIERARTPSLRQIAAFYSRHHLQTDARVIATAIINAVDEERQKSQGYLHPCQALYNVMNNRSR